MAKKIFVTGISTEVGKTLISAICVEALQADYWKPVQAGELDNTDAMKVGSLISNSTSVIHKTSYELKTPMSPHAAAEIDDVVINLENITPPKTNNHLIIEGAGGLLVPLNDTDTILDIIDKDYHVIVVSRHYLGSINHTLLTLHLLKEKGYKVSLIYSGDEHPTTESIIKKMTNVPVIGRVGEEVNFDKEVIKKYASKFKNLLETL